jgi:peroxiredoxin
MQIKYFLALLLGLFFARTPLLAQTKWIKITCNVRNPVDSLLTFTYTKGVYKPFFADTIKKIEVGKNVEFQIESDKPLAIKIMHDFRYFEAFCEPGDSIHLSFNAEIYPTEIAFSSNRVGVQNKVLHQFRQAFLMYSDKVIVNNIKTTQGLIFRKYMDEVYGKKWAFFNHSDSTILSQCSQNFNHFVTAEINYWYAYYLMLYRAEHASLVTAENLYLPDAYYDFLDEILINDDDAFLHQNYAKFLQLYYELRKSYPDFPHGLAARQVIVRAKMAVPLYQNADCTKQIATILPDNKMVVVDNLTYTPNTFSKQPIAYRIKVKTQNGYWGWLKTQHIEIDNTAEKLNRKALYINNLDLDYYKELIDATATFDTLDLYLDPSDKNSYLSVTKEEKLAVLNDLTINRVDFNKKGEYYSSPFNKIRTKYGMIGWVSIAGIKLFFQRGSIKEWSSKIAMVSNTPYMGFDYFLYGKALQYVYGLELKEKMDFNGKNKVQSFYSFFQKNCTYQDLKSEMALIFDTEDKKFNLDTVAMQLKEIVIDQRKTNLNQRTNQFILENDEILGKTPNTALAKKNENDTIKRLPAKLNSNVLLDLTFPEANYEYQTITIKGTKKLMANYDIAINLSPDLLNDVSKFQSFKINKGKYFWQKDTFAYKIQAVEPIRGYIKTKNDSFVIWLEPNQQYYISEKNGKIKLTGIGVNNFEFLAAVAELDKKIDTETKNHATLNSIAYKNWIKTQLTTKQQFLKDFHQTKTLTERFYRLMAANNDYWAANRLLDYAESHKEIKKDSSYFDFTKDIIVQNDRALQSIEYQQFIPKFLKQQTELNKFAYLSKGDPARSIYSGRVLNYWQVYDARERILNANIDDKLITDVRRFAENNTYQLFNESLKTLFQNVVDKKEGWKIPNFQMSNMKNEKIDLADLKSKVVWVHFWSVKQKDYQKELKALRKMAKKMKSPDLIFLKVNTDAEYGKWKKAMRRQRRDKYNVFVNDANTYVQNFNDYFGKNQNKGDVIIDKKGAYVSFKENFVAPEMIEQLQNELKKY